MFFKRKQSLLLFDFELMRVKNEILSSRTKEAIESRFAYLGFLSREFFGSSSSPYRRLLLHAYADLAGRGMEAELIALFVIEAIEDDYVSLDAMNDPNGRLSRTDKWALVLSARTLSRVGRWAVVFGKAVEVLDKACTALTFLSEIGSSLEFRQLETEVHDSLDRMRSEIERLPLKKRASPLTGEHKKRIDSAFEKLESLG